MKIFNFIQIKLIISNSLNPNLQVKHTSFPPILNNICYNSITRGNLGIGWYDDTAANGLIFCPEYKWTNLPLLVSILTPLLVILTVLSIGDGFVPNGTLIKPSLKPGQYVLLPEYGGAKAPKVQDQENLVLYQEEDIIAVVEGEFNTKIWLLDFSKDFWLNKHCVKEKTAEISIELTVAMPNLEPVIKLFCYYK